MPSTLSLEIQQTLEQYLTGNITVDDLQAHLVTMVWEVEEHEAPDVVDLFHDAELSLAEFTSGDWTEEELKGLLRQSLMSLMVGVGTAG